MDDELSPASPAGDPPARPRRRRAVTAAIAAAVAVCAVVVGVKLVSSSGHPDAPANGALVAPASSGPAAPPASASVLARSGCSGYGLSGPVNPAGSSPTTSQTPQRIALGKGDRIADAIQCRFEMRTYPGDGEWQVVVTDHITSGLAALTAAYQLPPGTAKAQACTLELDTDPPIVVELADGRVVLPIAPRDSCNHVRRELLDAIGQLSGTDVATQKLEQLRSDGQVTSGCSQVGWKDMLEIADQQSQGSAVELMADTYRVCRYGPPKGQIVTWVGGGGTVTKEALSGALATRTPTTGCDRTASGVLVIEAVSSGQQVGGQYFQVEVGGCNRLWDGEHIIGAIPSTAVDTLVSAAG